MSTGIELNSRSKYLISNENETRAYESFITSELRAYYAEFADPLTLNFKLMIDFKNTSGLFATEDNVDSALAYLKRIGETTRYETLKHWISVFKGFVKNYDFLILGCDGIDSIINAKPYEAFTENDKITFTIRETSDMLIQSLLTQYRHIWYDNEKNVEVLPINLRRFDCNILIYSAGYFNMALYDVMENNDLTDKDLQTKIFPTIKKLSDKYFVDNAETYKFNHHLITIGDAQINNEDSGKSFFTNISNEMSGDMIKNTLVLNFRFGTYKGTFNNIFGEFDFVKLLAIASAQDKVANKESVSSFISKLKNSINSDYKQTLSTIASKPTAYKNKLLKPSTPIGNAFKNLKDTDYVSSLVKNMADVGIQKVDDYVDKQIVGVNNLVMDNFSDSFLDAYKNYFDNDTTTTDKVKLMSPTEEDKLKILSKSNQINKSQDMVKYEVSNIYNRKSF